LPISSSDIAYGSQAKIPRHPNRVPASNRLGVREAMSEYPPEIVEGPSGPTASGSSPVLLEALLASLDKLLFEREVPTEDLLMPGAQGYEIAEELAPLALKPNAELLVWWGWHNGTQLQEDGRRVRGLALPGFAMGGVHDATRNYRRFLGVIDGPSSRSLSVNREREVEYADVGGGTGWLPLGRFGDGMLIECAGDPEAPPMLHSSDPEFRFPDSENYMRAQSLCTIVTWWIEEISAGGWTWDPANSVWNGHTGLQSPTRKRALFGF
jgi:hypothetical protein